LVAGEQGELVPVGDSLVLSEAIARAIIQRPSPKPVTSSLEWASIGHKTRELYQASRARRRAGRDATATQQPLATVEPPP